MKGAWSAVCLTTQCPNHDVKWSKFDEPKNSSKLSLRELHILFLLWQHLYSSHWVVLGLGNFWNLMDTFGRCINPFPNDKFKTHPNWTSRRQLQILWAWQKVLQKGRKRCGKRRNCSLRAISPFSTVFSKDLYRRDVKTRACLWKS